MQTEWDRRRLATQRRNKLRERAVVQLGGSCRICGYGRCLSGLEFHHTNPLEKDFSISAKMTSWEAIRPELDKCVLLCANCHREVHEGLHTGYLEDESVRWSDHDEDFEPFEETERHHLWCSGNVNGVNED